MKAHIDKTRAQLGDLGSLAKQTEAAERRILSSATKRLKEVQSSIGRMQAGADSAPDKEQQRYLELIEERGKLHTVIANAKESLSNQS